MEADKGDEFIRKVLREIFDLRPEEPILEVEDSAGEIKVFRVRR